MTDLKLIQFQCQREGHLFYFQGYLEFVLDLGEPRCPFCKCRARLTGREYPAINERDPEAFLDGQDHHTRD